MTRFRANADLGLLLFRLATGLSLFFNFGLQKVLDGLTYFHTGHWSFVDFNVKLGLPLPVVVAVVETLNESVGALLVAAGLWTRYAGLALVVGFAAATICSLIMGEFAWRFAAMYCLLAAAVVAGGPGRYSLDARAARGTP